MKDNGQDSLLTFLAGMAVGAIAMLLFAPESGSQVRQRLGRYAREAGEELAEEGTAAWERGRRAVDSAVERGKDYVERGKDYVEGARETLRDKASAIADEVGNKYQEFQQGRGAK
jgi:gas vesicle protein